MACQEAEGVGEGLGGSAALSMTRRPCHQQTDMLPSFNSSRSGTGHPEHAKGPESFNSPIAPDDFLGGYRANIRECLLRKYRV